MGRERQVLRGARRRSARRRSLPPPPPPPPPSPSAVLLSSLHAPRVRLARRRAIFPQFGRPRKFSPQSATTLAWAGRSVRRWAFSCLVAQLLPDFEPRVG